MAEEKYTANECFEKFSRGTLKFNMALDRAVFKPVAKGYRALPVPIRKGSSNFIENLRSLLSFSNNVLQGDLKGAANTAGRFAVNTTVGILGVFDPATKMGLTKRSRRFWSDLRSLGCRYRMLLCFTNFRANYCQGCCRDGW